MNPAIYAKAIASAVIAFVGAGATAATDGAISFAEWWVIGSATVVAAGAVFGVRNAEEYDDYIADAWGDQD